MRQIAQRGKRFKRLVEVLCFVEGRDDDRKHEKGMKPGSLIWYHRVMFEMLVIFTAKYLIVLPVIVLLAYFVFAKRAQKYRLTWLVVISMTLAYAFARLASDFYDDPRPFVVGHFKPLIEHAADNGFPSDHMLLAASIAAIVFYFNKRTGVVLWLVAFAIGFSRVAAGIHHTLDIIASAVISIFAVIIAHYLVQGLRRQNRIVGQGEVDAS